jgi:23S rRNA pseudouridine1911/1915/1917 synthase
VKEGRVIKDILIKEFDISSRLLRKLKLNQRIYCNDKIAWVNGNAKPGDEIKVNIFFEEEAESINTEYGKIDILYEDDSLLLVNKNGNMVSHPTCLHQSGTLANFVKGYFENKGEKLKVRFVNRLDRETSGIIVLAKNDYAQDILSKQMQSGDFIKEYIAIVHGSLEKSSGTIDLPIKREPDSIMTRMVALDGENAITHYEVIERLENMTVLKLRLETGRTHQIRVHLKAIGHPILGDGLYSNIETSLINRQALHSYRTGFIHPITHEKILVTANLPLDMEKIIKAHLT